MDYKTEALDEDRISEELLMLRDEIRNDEFQKEYKRLEVRTKKFQVFRIIIAVISTGLYVATTVGIIFLCMNKGGAGLISLLAQAFYWNSLPIFIAGGCALIIILVFGDFLIAINQFYENYREILGLSKDQNGKTAFFMQEYERTKGTFDLNHDFYETEEICIKSEKPCAEHVLKML